MVVSRGSLGPVGASWGHLGVEKVRKKEVWGQEKKGERRKRWVDWLTNGKEDWGW